jgi:hypothetical protein
MKKVIVIIVGFCFVLSLTGFSIQDSGKEAVKSLADHQQISDDNKDNAGECPYLNCEIKSSCPYLNGEVICPSTEKKSDDGLCPYLKDKEKPAKNYRTIKQTST